MKEEQTLPQCPFYREHDKGSILCEGFQKGTALRTEFAKDWECSGYFSVYCASLEGSRWCPVYALLLEKYEKERVE